MQKGKKVEIFPKGLTHGFGIKMVIFSTFLFQQHRPGKYLLGYSKTKKRPFQSIKTRSSNSCKTDIFPKGLTHGFARKIAIFDLFFRQYKPGKLLLTIFQNQKTPVQAIKTRSSNSRKIDIFPKGLTRGFGPKMAIFCNLFFLGNIRLGKCLL